MCERHSCGIVDSCFVSALSASAGGRGLLLSYLLKIAEYALADKVHKQVVVSLPYKPRKIIVHGIVS